MSFLPDENPRWVNRCYIDCLDRVLWFDVLYWLSQYSLWFDIPYWCLDLVYGSICYTCYLDMVYGSICYTCYLDMDYVSICCIGCLDWTSLLQNIVLALRKDFLRSFTWQVQKIFQKTDILDPLTRTHTYAYQGLDMLFVREIFLSTNG